MPDASDPQDVAGTVHPEPVRSYAPFAWQPSKKMFCFRRYGAPPPPIGSGTRPWSASSPGRPWF